MADVTIADLVALEPRLRLRQSADDLPPAEVGWVVAARTSPPMVPTLRGGELVFFGEGAIAAVGQPWPALMADLERLGAIGVIVPATVAPTIPYSSLPVLAFQGEGSPGEIEGMLNRAITEFRGELYRSGSDLGRLLGVLGAAGAPPARIVRETSTILGLPVRFTGAGELFAEHDPRTDPSSPPSWEHAVVPGGYEVMVGWTDRRYSALARIAADRLAEALAAATRRADAERPRGPARARGLAQFLFGVREPDDLALRSSAFQLGLSPDAEYRVAIAPASAWPDVSRVTATATHTIEAGSVDGDPAWLLETRAHQPAWSALVDRFGDAPRGPDTATGRWLAVSSPTHGFVGLPEVAAEARYVAALLRTGRIAGRVVAFDDARALGAWRLLYPLRTDDALRAFASGILRDLPERDRRGDLRRTLTVFLEAGGASVEAARLLGIHRNTLAYRLRQIASLTGLDPLEPANRLSLQLALMTLDVPVDPVRGAARNGDGPRADGAPTRR